MSNYIEYKVQVYPRGSRYWSLNGKNHREDGPAIEYADGSKEWWINGQRHREDGPAVEFADGYKAWYINGERHREDGPAVELTGGKSWWINGKKLTEKEFNKRTKVTEMTMEDICKALGKTVKVIK